MKDKTENVPKNIDSLSFDKLLSMSRILREGIRYGKQCCLKEINTDTDRDIFKYPVRIDAYVFVVCSSELIELTYNLYNMTLPANSMFLYNPGTILQLNALTPSRLSIMVFTRKFIDELGIKLDNIPLQYKIVREHQIFSLTEQTCNQLRSMMSMTADFIRLDNLNTYQRELVDASFRTFIYRALYEFNSQYGNYEAGFLPAQENNHFDNFMRLLEENYKRQHSIKFYSDKMNLSPKYLSLMIKKVSGKLATEWIDEYVILEAKNLIKYSSMNIQEISYALNFPNQSFFGKYFKRHTGLSPKAYRIKP